MMRSVLFALMFSGSVFGLSANAYAQTSPDTRQTDQSEEDWRKSKKKGGTSSEDILDIIKNTRSTGTGNGRGYSPIDALPEESRRHLMKERAKRMAQAGPNEPVDVTYKPSEAAKSDTDLQDDEKKAWEKMAQGMNGAPNQGQGQGQGQGQLGQQGQGQQGQSQGGGSQDQQQGGGQSSDPSSQSGQSRSVMRGGSAASVSDIMARIKGIGAGGGGTGQGQGQQGQSQQNSQGQQDQGQKSGQSSQGQGQQGQAQQSQGQQGQTQSVQNQQGQSQSQSQIQNKGQSQQDQQQEANSKPDAQGQAEAQSKVADEAHSLAHAQQDTSQDKTSNRIPEAISPLDRIKKVNQEQDRVGSRSSASDYLKKKD